MSQRSLPEFFTPRSETPKRRRSNSSSEEEIRINKDKRQNLSNMGSEEKVGQLSVSQLKEIFSDLIDAKGLATKQDLASTNAEIASLKKENAVLRREINDFRVRFNIQERNMRRNNLIFGGIDHTDTGIVLLIEDFIKQVLKIDNAVIIGKAFPLGKQGMRRRPILVEFVRGEDVSLIMSRVGCLKGTNFYVHRDYSQDDRIMRGKLLAIKKEVLKLKRDAIISIRNDTLIVDGIALRWNPESGLISTRGDDGVLILREQLRVDLSEAMTRLSVHFGGNEDHQETAAD
ncbi:hypothetical protein GE061_001408 [Apolygus lucorum]|uniref:Uncharacterized protein n=1 Tax=Apolygus lucorum TaxID=248454 RepID=A0A8S9YEA5_APOLU|nr:hypothetical protein GE061_001408 [Apolygus lucorum]